MKRVCILTSVHQSFDTRIFHKQAKTLVKGGYEVTLVAQHDRDKIVDGVNIVALSKPSNRFWRVLGTCKIFGLGYKEKADVYHFHDPELIPIAILLKLTRRAKIIYDVHEDVPNQILTKAYIPLHLRWFVSKAATLIDRIAFPLLDAVIAASEDIIWHFPRSKKIVAVRNFASLEMVRESGAAKGRRDEGQPAVLIYVGGISEGRGIKEMVEAVNQLGNRVRLMLVGTFSNSSLEDDIRARASSQVEFMGQVPYRNVPSFLSKADIALVCFRPDPNNIEAAWRNNKLFEYMAAGLPSIASNFPLWREIVEGNNCGLNVNPLDPREIAKAIEYLIEHPDEANKMGENGRKAVIEKYNWEIESKKLLALYEDLLKEERNKQ